MTAATAFRCKGPNDIVFDADGGFWFTDFGKTYGRLMDAARCTMPAPTAASSGEATSDA